MAAIIGAIGVAGDDTMISFQGKTQRLPESKKTPFYITVSHNALKNTRKSGDPDRIRTCGLQIRNLSLYPTELRGPGDN